METQKQTYTRLKLTVPYFDFKTESFIGEVIGFDAGFSRTWGNPFVIVKLRSSNGDLYNAVLDGGLRGALKLAKIIEGDIKDAMTMGVVTKETESLDVSGLRIVRKALIEIVHTGTKEVDQGECNTYDIFELDPNN